MKKQIEQLEILLKELKEVYFQKELQRYETSTHKHFDKGDIVTDGNYIAIVEWTENNGIGRPYHKGYMGCSIINNSRGFCTFKRDEFQLLTDEYYNKSHNIAISLTGLEIEDLKYILGHRNLNPNKAKEKLLDIFDLIKVQQ